eukprot:3187680-Pyramimonas_sp.AAC.1
MVTAKPKGKAMTKTALDNAVKDCAKGFTTISAASSAGALLSPSANAVNATDDVAKSAADIMVSRGASSAAGGSAHQQGAPGSAPAASGAGAAGAKESSGDPGSASKKQKFDVGVSRLQTAEAKNRMLATECDKLAKALALASKTHKEGGASGESEKGLLMERFVIGAMVLGKEMTIEMGSIESAPDVNINGNFTDALKEFKEASKRQHDQAEEPNDPLPSHLSSDAVTYHDYKLKETVEKALLLPIDKKEELFCIFRARSLVESIRVATTPDAIEEAESK